MHLCAAPVLWTVIGGLLIHRGWGWLEPGQGGFAVPVAATFGTLKSLLILDQVAARALRRLDRFEDGACLGAVYSWRTWLLVLVMMLAGAALRWAIKPGTTIAILYLAIGWSLCLSSRIGWRRWLQSDRGNGIT